MSLVVAGGGDWPRVIRTGFGTQEDALAFAKGIFARFYAPSASPNPIAFPIYVYDDPRLRPYGLVRGTRLDGVTWESWNGLQRREDARTAYPPTWREPPPPTAPPMLSEREFKAYLDGLQPQGTGGFGPVIPDGIYRLTGFAGELTVRYDADGTGDHSDPPAWGPENAPEDSADQIYEWKYRAVPNGIDPAVVAWSDPTGPVAAVPPLYPGVPTRLQALDRYEETDILELDVQTPADYAEFLFTLRVLDPYTGYLPAPLYGDAGIPWSLPGGQRTFRVNAVHNALLLPPTLTSPRFVLHTYGYDVWGFDDFGAWTYLGSMGAPVDPAAGTALAGLTWPLIDDTTYGFDAAQGEEPMQLLIPFGDRFGATLPGWFIQYYVGLTPYVDNVFGGGVVGGNTQDFPVVLAMRDIDAPSSPPPPSPPVSVTVAVGDARIPATGASGFYGIPKALYVGNMADGRNVYTNWLYAYAPTPAPSATANTPDGQVCLGYETAEPLGPAGAPSTAMKFLYWEQPILVSGPTRFWMLLQDISQAPDGWAGYLIHTNYPTGLPSPPQGQRWPFYSQRPQ